ncbi:CheR family methyltransferase [Sphingomonas sp. ID0503]|uniref:CheR family methyltransferase n=1 Tax=Sphingomonas sp. ID0503 TaxID=3399691 RepID=UPI003AFB521F
MELNSALGRILSGLLESRTGQQIGSARHWRIDTALQPLLRARGLPDLDALAALLLSGRDPGIADEIVEHLLNNETSFFRDPAVFDVLRRVIADRAGDMGRPLRIWCAGCSTGQEAYSLAITLADLRENTRHPRAEIIATDISAAAIRRAQAGAYNHFEIQRGLPIRALAKWFANSGEAWEASAALRGMVRFERRALAAGPPSGGPFDVILCRNVMLYFSNEVRRQMFEQLFHGMREDGFLLLGAGETVIGATERFAADRGYRGLYRAVPDASDGGGRAARG